MESEPIGLEKRERVHELRRELLALEEGFAADRAEPRAMNPLTLDRRQRRELRMRMLRGEYEAYQLLKQAAVAYGVPPRRHPKLHRDALLGDQYAQQMVVEFETSQRGREFLARWDEEGRPARAAEASA